MAFSLPARGPQNPVASPRRHGSSSLSADGLPPRLRGDLEIVLNPLAFNSASLRSLCLGGCPTLCNPPSPLAATLCWGGDCSPPRRAPEHLQGNNAENPSDRRRSELGKSSSSEVDVVSPRRAAPRIDYHCTHARTHRHAQARTCTWHSM